MSAAEAVAIARSVLERRRIERDLEETEEFFRERARKQAEEEAEREREERSRQAAERAESERTEWLRLSEEYALRQIHPDVPAERRLAALKAIRTRLEALVPLPTPEVTRAIVNAALDVTLGPFRRLDDRDAVLDELRRMWRFERDRDQWGIPALQAAALAIAELLAEDAKTALADLRKAAKEAGEGIISQNRHQERCRRMAEDSWWALLLPITAEQLEHMKVVIEKALLALPVTASDGELEATRESLIRPLRDAARGLEPSAIPVKSHRPQSRRPCAPNGAIRSRLRMPALDRRFPENSLESTRSVLPENLENFLRAFEL